MTLQKNVKNKVDQEINKLRSAKYSIENINIVETLWRWDEWVEKQN